MSEVLSKQTTTVGKYLIERLASLGVGHVFGVPGDFVIGFCSLVSKSDKLKWIGCCNELNAAYSADGYSRINAGGVSCVVTTFGVGELSAINGIAGSWIEHQSVVMISGIPSKEARKQRLPLHHSLEDYNTPRKLYKRVTSANVLLDDPEQAPKKIDHCLSVCVRKKRPVYISLPVDIVDTECASEPLKRPIIPRSTIVDEESLKDALKESAKMINEAKNPLFITDIGILRANVYKEFLELLERSQIPFVSMLMGKGIYDETHPLFIGTYHGKRSRKEVSAAVDKADVIVKVGFVLTDKNTGGFSVNIPNEKVISISDSDETVQIKRACFNGITLQRFLCSLTPLITPRIGINAIPHTKASETSTFSFQNQCIQNPQQQNGDEAITSSKLFCRIAHSIPEGSVIVADAGVASFGTAELLLRKGCTYISQSFYVSIGYSVPAAFGASIACMGNTNRKVFLFVGDGSFQMTAQEIGSMIKYKCNNVVVLLLNNHGYTVERLIHEGAFNDIGNWNYSNLPIAFGASNPGVIVKTMNELDNVLVQKIDQKQQKQDLTFIEVILPVDDAPPSLVMAAQDMRSKK